MTAAQAQATNTKIPLSPEVIAALRANARRTSRAFTRGLRPPKRRNPAQWARDEANIPEGVSVYSGKYDPDNNAPLREIEVAAGPDDPCASVQVMGCAQSGKSKYMENVIGHAMTDYPCSTMWISDTKDNALQWAEEKLWPFVNQTKALRKATWPLGGPAGKTSTMKRLRGRTGGYLVLAGANSVASLSQKSIRILVKDEWDKWTDNVEGQGDPDGKANQRIKTFEAVGKSKTLMGSTPLYKSSRSWSWFIKMTDQRYHYQRCQGCGGLVDWRYEDLKYNTEGPLNPTLICPSCGTVHEEWQRREMLVEGRNICTAPQMLNGGLHDARPPKYIPPEEEDFWAARMKDHPHKGLHLHGVTNQMGSWTSLIQTRLDCGEDPQKIRVWVNENDGCPYELELETPAIELLEAIKEQDWGYQTRGSRAPFGPAVFTMGVDVQGNGLWTSITGWYDRKERWMLDREFLDGDTDSPGQGAWLKLEAKSRAGVTLSSGAIVPFDGEIVDGGFNAEPVRHYVRKGPNRKAGKGEDGWSRPLWGQIATMEYQKAGKRLGQRARGKSQTHLIGTWPAKVILARFLRDTVEWFKNNAVGDFSVHKPFGLVHLSRDDGPDELAQITAASIQPVLDKKTGITKRIWKKTGDDHLLDCDVYQLALWDGLALDRHSPDDWARLRTARDQPKASDQGDLFGAALIVSSPPSAAQSGDPLQARDRITQTEITQSGRDRANLEPAFAPIVQTRAPLNTPIAAPKSPQRADVSRRGFEGW